MINRILLDLDDVLNQFTMWALKCVGCDVDPMDNSQFPIQVGYDIVAAANLLHPTKRDWKVAEFWDSIKRHHWARTPISPECNWLLETCIEKVGEDEVFIVTSPTKDPDCLAGKLEWIHLQMPCYMHRQYSITPRKHIAASPGTLLIDDCADNCEKFEEKNGQALLVPKPWNHRNGWSTRGYLEKFFQGVRFQKD
jgi:5'(3')-deoxyribonucleotidase